MKARKSRLHQTCVYTIGSIADLEHYRRGNSGRGSIVEGKAWKTGKAMLAEAQSNDLLLPLLLGDAASTDGVRWWAVIDSIELMGEGGTLVSFHGLRALPERIRLHDLVVDSTGERLSDDFIRPYAICRTPRRIVEEAQRQLVRQAWYSVKDYVRALRDIEPRMSSRQRAMLVGHYASPARRLSENRLAKLGGYAAGSAANLQYGKLAGMVAKALGHTPLGDLSWTIAVWTTEKDKNGHGQWILRKEVARALEELGWVDDNRTGITAEAARRRILESDPQLAGESPTSRKALVDARLGHGRFRSQLIGYWRGCAVTGCAEIDLLIASHIVPWAGATNKQRLDPYNGLLLTPNLDALFDRHMISFKDDGTILISNNLNTVTRRLLGLSQDFKLSKVDKRHLPYLAQHRERFFE